ncbi:MAG: thiamine pyrophosphate-dependent enzyme [Planctomycetota bacterium]
MGEERGDSRDPRRRPRQEGRSPKGGAADPSKGHTSGSPSQRRGPNVLTLLPAPGRRTEPFHDRLSLGPDDLRDLYRGFLVARGVDAQCSSWHQAGRIAFWVPSSGNEAIDFGTARASESADWLFPSMRHLGLALARGITAQQLFDAVLGNANDPSRGRQLPTGLGFLERNLVPVSSGLATQLVHAAGCAAAMRLRGERSAVLAYCGIGATQTSDFGAALDVARLRKAPVVFVCGQNPGVEPAKPALTAQAQARGIPAARVDGTDVFAMLKASRDALARAKRGDGASLIEAIRPKASPTSNGSPADRFDPIERLRHYVLETGTLKEDDLAHVEDEIRRELEEGAAAALETPKPPASSRFDDVWSEEPLTLTEQRSPDAPVLY